MKNVILISLTLVISCQVPETVSFSDTDIAAVEAATNQYSTAILGGDYDKIRTLAHPDIVLMPPGAQLIKGTDAVIEWMQQGPAPEGSLNPEDVQGSGDIAYVRGNFDLIMKINDSTQVSENGKYVEIWRKMEDGSWKVQTDVWNSNTSPDHDH